MAAPAPEGPQRRTRLELAQAALARARDEKQRARGLLERLRAQVAELRTLNSDLREQNLALQTQRASLPAVSASPLPASRVQPKPPAAAGPLVTALAHGQDLVAACVAETRRLVRTKQRLLARSFAQALREQPGMEAVGALCCAVEAWAHGLVERAAARLAEVPEALVKVHAPLEQLGCLLAHQPEAAVIRLGELGAALTAAERYELAGPLVAAGQADAAQRLLDGVVEEPDFSQASEALRLRVQWMRQKLAARARALASVPPPATEPQLGVLAYQALDLPRVSGNLGDPVQTLAYLGQLARFTHVQLDAEPPLESFVAGLRERLEPGARLPAPAGRARLVLVDRDFASGRTYCTPTWLLAYGWFLHPVARGRFDFPFPPSIRPLFLSLHVHDKTLLTAEVVEYLRRYGPVGCRDWSTVYALHELGVPCFFSGCLSLTLAGLFPERAPAPADAPVAWVDCAPDAPGAALRLAQRSPRVRKRSLAENLAAALQHLEQLRGCSRVVTGRLHSYLPCRALGLKVDFRPPQAADRRFDGLVGLDAAQNTALAGRLEAKLARLHARILAGGAEPEIYALWRELCADEVDAARARCAAPTPVARDARWQEQAAAIRAQAWAVGPDTDVPGRVELALALDENLAEQLPVVLQSLCENTRRPLRFHICTRGIPRETCQLWADCFPEASFVFLPCESLGYGPQLRVLQHTSVATIDRLLLPELLPKVARVLYLDIDILVRGDIGLLYDLDLRGCPFAARPSLHPSWRFGWQLFDRAARGLAPAPAAELRRYAHQRGAFFSACNAGVLLLDLARLRADDFSARFLPWVVGYGLNDQDALNLYAGAERVALEPGWNAVPTQGPSDGAQLLHWAGTVKPWGALFVSGQPEYQAARQRWLQRRAALQPGSGTGSGPR